MIIALVARGYSGLFFVRRCEKKLMAKGAANGKKGPAVRKGAGERSR